MSAGSTVVKRSALAVVGSFTTVVGFLVVFALIFAVSLFPSGGADASTGANGSGIKEGTVPAEYVQLYLDNGTLCAAISPALLAAQGRAESNFNPNARSPVGAQGIAQFMPATWAAYGNGGDPFDPADAIAAQARYDCALAEDVARVPGDPTSLMLAAYNAGPYAVLLYNDIPPYAETEAYVERILGYVAEMTVASAGGPVSLSDPGLGSVNGDHLTPRAANVKAIVEQRWGCDTNPAPCVSSIGGWDPNHAPGSDHITGNAIDAMVGRPGTFAQGGDKALGDAIANFFIENADALGINYVIWYGRIWQNGRWTAYNGGGNYDPTSATGGHFDHPHISVKTR